MAQRPDTIQTSDGTAIYQRPESLAEMPMRYCPGCGHGISHRLVAEAIDELQIRDRAIVIASVGCSVYAYEYFETDAIQAAHGRAPAVGTGIKRVRPDSVVVTYQGDGDLASIGVAEVVHAAMRGEHLTVVFINNGVFGMTRGQMAPTTLLGQETTTSPGGRKPEHSGHPLDVCALLEDIPGVVYLSREALFAPKHVRNAKKAVIKAFRTQLDGLGFSLVEILSTCPHCWKMSPMEAMEYVRDTVTEQYPLDVYKDPYSKEEAV